MELPDFLHRNADGEICLKGRRIRLIDVAARFEEGHSAETVLLDHYPDLDLALVYKTIGFYLDHQEEVRSLIEKNRQAMQELEAQPRRPTPSLAELRRRMAAKRREAS